jgi:ATP-binding cassette subfamily B multidrug efflux pump
MPQNTSEPKIDIRLNGRMGGPKGRMMLMNKEKPKDAKGTFKRLISYIGKNRYIFFSLIGVMLIITVLGLAAPAIQQVAIDCISVSGENVSIEKEKFIRSLVFLALTYSFNAIFTYLQGILSAKLSQTTVHTMRRDLFANLVRLPVSYTDTHNHGDIMSRMTNDIENISTTIAQSIGSLISSIMTVVGSLVIMLYYSPLLTAISMSTIFLTIGVSAALTKLMRKYFLKQQILLGKINGHAEEMVTGYKTVVSYSKEDDAKKEFETLSNELRKVGIKAQLFGGVMGPVMNIISNLNFVLIAAFGGWFAIKGAISIGTIQAFIIYSKQFSRPVNDIASQYAQIQTAIAGAERVFEVMDAKEEENSFTDSYSSRDIKGDVSFKDVCFAYVPEKPVLKGLSLDVKQGQKIAVVGATGSGKTTVVNLLTRFYNIDSGSITIDSHSIYDISIEELRKSIAIVLQDTVLFTGTIADNIRYSKLDATDDEVKHAAAIANADEFIDRLPDGYNTILSESGSNLSQGQRQLISIARAVLANPKILVLDEATSSVDTRTEMNIQSAMVKLMKNRTSLIIAHRLSTIRDADKIVVVDNGKIAEKGSHDELIKQHGRYYQLYQTQFAGIET